MSPVEAGARCWVCGSRDSIPKRRSSITHPIEPADVRIRRAAHTSHEIRPVQDSENDCRWRSVPFLQADTVDGIDCFAQCP